MEIAENITWTEELERLDVLLSQGQFELLLPGERYGGGEKEIWLVYLMNDAAESFLVFHDAELTGTYQKEYEGEIDAALEKDGEQYVLIVRQKETVCTLFSAAFHWKCICLITEKRVISGWTDTSICGRLSSVLRSCGTSWNTSARRSAPRKKCVWHRWPISRRSISAATRPCRISISYRHARGGKRRKRQLRR